MRSSPTTATKKLAWPRRGWWSLSRRGPLSAAELPAADWLAAQVKELEVRSMSELAPIAVIKLQIEDFGRATRPELDEVAGWLQSCLPVYERFFRVDDRDFILLAPGADIRKARALSLTLRDRVGSQPLQRGGWMHLRCGACASRMGNPFDFSSVSSIADEALEAAEAHDGVAALEMNLRDQLRDIEDR